MISLFLLNMLLLAGLRAKVTAGGNPAIDYSIPSRRGGESGSRN